MLLKNLLRVPLLTFGLVLPGLAASAADEHIVIILESAYFPTNTTVVAGDVVRFVNESGRDHAIFHAQGKWASRALAHGEELLVTIEPDMGGAYYGMSETKITGQLDLTRPNVAD